MHHLPEKNGGDLISYIPQLWMSFIRPSIFPPKNLLSRGIVILQNHPTKNLTCDIDSGQPFWIRHRSNLEIMYVTNQICFTKNSPKNRFQQTQHPQKIAKNTSSNPSRLLTPCCSFVTFAIRMVLGIPCFTGGSRISRVWQLLEREYGLNTRVDPWKWSVHDP